MDGQIGERFHPTVSMVKRFKSSPLNRERLVLMFLLCGRRGEAGGAGIGFGQPLDPLEISHYDVTHLQ